MRFRPARCFCFLTCLLLLAASSVGFAQQSTPVAAVPPPSGPKPVARTVLCLFGFQASDPTRAPVWPPDTYTAQMLQMAMEWRGYETEFHDVGQGRPPMNLDEKYTAVILDSVLELPFTDEDYYLNWVQHQKARGLKVLFIGGYPFDSKDRREELFETLGIHGSGDEIVGAKNATFRVADKTMLDTSLLAQPKSTGLVSAQAPEKAKVWLSISAQDARDVELVCDAAYTAPWGGAVLEPYLNFRTSPEDVRSFLDVFAFVDTLLPPDAFPAPDTTTRDGLRMFLTHIDGDGFTTLSKKSLNVTCAEIIRDQFLTHYPFPVTVSVIESETKALLKEQTPSDRARYEDIARSLFALPNVQAASHAWSHPFVWMPGKDIEGGRGYATQWLEFADSKTYPVFDLHREIEGSVAYIRNNLLPKGKNMEVFLWSGNCRPSGEALRMVAKLGLEAMNGGNTTINRRAEGIAAISSKDVFMDGELQVYAPVQNEYTYTNGFTGPLYGGYRLVLDTFKRTESPRRLKPVNVYYHFYSVQTGESLRALRDVHEWCLAQPLHSVTVRDFVRLAKDARATRLFRDGEKRWIAENAGLSRTYRIGASSGVPNLARCEGVTGWTEHEGQLYLHTDGRKRVVMDFSQPATQAQPHLVSSSGEIRLRSLKADSFAGSVSDLRENAVTLSGLPPGVSYALTITIPSDKEPPRNSAAQVDKTGTLRLMLPPLCAFSGARAAP